MGDVVDPATNRVSGLCQDLHDGQVALNEPRLVFVDRDGHFVQLVISDASISVRAISPDGELLDEIALIIEVGSTRGRDGEPRVAPGAE